MTRLERFGFTPERRASCPPGDYARIVSGHGDYFHLVCDLAQGEIIARKKASAFRDPEAVQPVTGDFVRIAYNPHGESRILEVMPRHSVFRRVDPSSSGHGIQILAVNFDVLFFVMSVNENFSLSRLARMRALAEESLCAERLVLVLSKCDLGEPPEPIPPDVAHVCVSVKTGQGMDALKAYMKPGETFALTGSSGVGKSSLVNACAGADWMPVQEIQSWSGKGRHTTTSRELVLLPDGVLALDTPGLRELGIPGERGGRFYSSGTHRFRV